MLDFWIKAPESLRQVTMPFSDRGAPDGYRHMHGFGSHTYSLINEAGERVFGRWHLSTQQGVKNLSAADAVRLAGEHPDYAQRDLFGAIARGDFPAWQVRIQVATAGPPRRLTPREMQDAQYQPQHRPVVESGPAVGHPDRPGGLRRWRSGRPCASRQHPPARELHRDTQSLPMRAAGFSPPREPNALDGHAAICAGRL